jgi:hypothetical protein
MPNSGKPRTLQISTPGGGRDSATRGSGSSRSCEFPCHGSGSFVCPELLSAKHQNPDGLGFAFGCRLFRKSVHETAVE